MRHLWCRLRHWRSPSTVTLWMDPEGDYRLTFCTYCKRLIGN